MNFVKCFAVCVAIGILPTVAFAADFPDRPVRFIVPFTPGGGVDIVARLVASKLSEMWSQPVLVENKPGAVGAIASEYVLQQPADGYTIMVGVAGSHALAKLLKPDIYYDRRDVQFVVQRQTPARRLSWCGAGNAGFDRRAYSDGDG